MLCIGSRTDSRSSVIPEIPGIICSFFILVLDRSSVLGFGPATTRFPGRVEVSSTMDLESR